MRILSIVLLSLSAFGQTGGEGTVSDADLQPKFPTTAPALTDAQVRTVREAQLAVSQAEVARERAKVAYYEAEMRFKAAQDELVTAMAKIPRPDGCPDCQINAQMKWAAPPKKEK